MESLSTAVWLKGGLGEVTGSCDCTGTVFALDIIRVASGSVGGLLGGS